MSLLTTELVYALSMLISAMNITDTLLPHGVAQVSFQYNLPNVMNNRSAERDVAGITARICTTLITRNSLRAGQPLSRVNLTSFTTPTSGYRKYLSLQKTKTWKLLLKLALPKFLLLPKKSELPPIFFFFWGGGGGGVQPPPSPPASPPGPYAYDHVSFFSLNVSNVFL